jgi:hypothetical protein
MDYAVDVSFFRLDQMISDGLEEPTISEPVQGRWLLVVGPREGTFRSAGL